jgi:hypothetical protein
LWGFGPRQFQQRAIDITDSGDPESRNISTGVPGLCPAGTKFFPQPIDHESFNGNWNGANETFLMQYEINDTYYKPSGPIFFYQGTENAVIACAEYTSIIN